MYRNSVRLDGVRRQVEEARTALLQSAERAALGDFDMSYRTALASRNQLFHATRALAAARHETMPEMPVTGLPGGSFADYLAARAQLDAALAMRDDITMVSPLAAARAPYARYLGWLRDELGRLLHPPTA